MSTLKILFISKCLPYIAGPAILAFDEAKAFVKMGHEVHFVTYASYPSGTIGGEEVDKALKHSGIQFHYVNEPSAKKTVGTMVNIAMLNEVLKVAKTFKTDVLYGHYAIPHGLIAVTASSLTGIPSLVTLYGTDAYQLPYENGFDTLSATIAQKATVLIAVSENLAREARSYTRNPKLPVTIEPMAIDCQRFFPRLDSLGSCDIPTILYAGRIDANKDVATIVKAFSQLLAQGGRAKLAVVGVGPELDSVRNLVWTLGVSGSVTVIAGAYEELPTIYRNADIFVLASKNEGIPNSVIEASASGLALVSTRVGDGHRFKNGW